MRDTPDGLRVCLFAVRAAQWISSVIVLGLTAYAVNHLKGYRTVFTLVIAVLSTAFYIPSFFVACMKRNRGYIIPLDIVFYALWLSAFIFVAQTDSTFDTDGIGCYYFVWDVTAGCKRRNAIEAFAFLAFFWTLCGLCVEIANVYLLDREVRSTNHPEKPVHDGPLPPSTGANGGTHTGSTPATNGDRAMV